MGGRRLTEKAEEHHIQVHSPSSLGLALLVIGSILLLSSILVVYPVGRSAPNNNGCPQDPEWWWLTRWPNVLSFDMGVVLAVTGLGSVRMRRGKGSQFFFFPPLAPLGYSLIASGVVLLLLGQMVSYVTHCPANGCPPLTQAQWWSLFWPNVIADALGSMLIVSGVVSVGLAHVHNTRRRENLRGALNQ